MAGSLTDYAENKILDHSTGKTSWTLPAGSYVGAFTTAPTDAGGGTEASGGAYARQSVTWNTAASGATDNSNTINFTTGWSGTVVAIAIFDAVTTGNMIWWMDLTANKTIGTTDVFQLPIGSIDLTLS